MTYTPPNPLHPDVPASDLDEDGRLERCEFVLMQIRTAIVECRAFGRDICVDAMLPRIDWALGDTLEIPS